MTGEREVKQEFSYRSPDGRPLTWGEIKQAVEGAGVRGDDTMYYFDLGALGCSISVRRLRGEFVVREG
jgi:hypothetical protein